MTLADELPPSDCIEKVAEKLEEHTSIILKNLPESSESPKTRLEKWSIVEQALLEIKEYTKEGLKARLIGSLYAVDDLRAGSMQSTLPDSDEDSTRCTITGPDGIEHETSVEQMEAVTEGIKRKDPKIMKKLKDLESEEHA